MAISRQRLRSELTPDEALAIVDKQLLSPDPALTLSLFGGLLVVVLVLCLLHTVVLASDFEAPVSPNALFFRKPQLLKTREVYGLYVIYSVTPVCMMFSYVLHLTIRQRSYTKRNFALCWAVKSFVAVFTALITLVKVAPAFRTPCVQDWALPRRWPLITRPCHRSGLVVYSGNIVSTIGTDLFFIPAHASAAPWSRRRLCAALVMEVTYKVLGYLSVILSGTPSWLAYIGSFSIGATLGTMAVLPTRPAGAGPAALTLDENAPRQSVFSRKQAIIMASLFTAARAFLSTHFTVTSHADPAVDYDGTRIMLFATMLQELVAPALIVHLAFIRVDSLVLQLMAEERDRHSMSRIDAQHHVVRWVCHEVRVPLSSVSLGIKDVDQTLRDVVENRPSDAAALHEGAVEMNQSLGIMSRALDRMQAVLDDMLTYEKLQHGQLQFSRSRFNLQGSIADVIHQFSHVAAQKNVELSARGAPFGAGLSAYTQALGDRTRLVQVLSNFTSNALKFVSSGDHVAIEYAAFLRRPKGCHSRWSCELHPLGEALSAQPACRSAIALALDTDAELFNSTIGQQSYELDAEITGGAGVSNDVPPPLAYDAGSGNPRVLLCVRVVDEGAGIKPEQQDKLFQPFSQLRSGEERGGTGLGLAICRAIAEMHHGFVGLWSAGVGQGTEFWLEWSFELHRPPSRAAIASAGAIPTLQLPPLPHIPGLPKATYSQRETRRASSRKSDSESSRQNPKSTRGRDWKVGTGAATGPVAMGSPPPASPNEAGDATADGEQAPMGTGQLGAVHLPGADSRPQPPGQEAPPRVRTGQPIALPMLPPVASGAGAPLSPMPSAPTLPKVPGAIASAGQMDPAEKGLPPLPGPQPPLPQLPQPSQGAESGAAASRSGALASPGPQQLQGMRIAVVDDQMGNRELLAKHLRRRGATVTTMEDGAEFLVQLGVADAAAGSGAGSDPASHAVAGTVDVVLLDKEMPRMTGYDVLAVVALAKGKQGLSQETEANTRRMIELYELHLPRIRRALARAHIVGVTGNALREDVDEYKRRGASEVIPKPVDVDRVVSVVKRLVKEA